MIQNTESSELPVAIMPLTTTQLKHELRTPINHIVGYSEMMLEELRLDGDPYDIKQVEEVCSIGKELVAVIDSLLLSSNGAMTVSAEISTELRGRIQETVNRIFDMQLEESTLAEVQPHANDLKRIFDVAARLQLFAVSGRIRESESAD